MEEAVVASKSPSEPPKVVLLIGGSGYVAQFVLKLLLERSSEFAIHATCRKGRNTEGMPAGVSFHELQPRSASDVEALLAAVCPDVIVNCAAMSSLKHCEADSSEAYEVNCPRGMLEAVQRWVAAVSRSLLLVHFSTDIVFDGDPDKVYSEESSAEPVNVYGRSKLSFDELLVTASTPPTCVVLRPPNILGPRHPYINTGNKFLQWLDGEMRGEKQCRLFVDEYRNYVWVEDLAAVVVKMIDDHPSKPPPFQLLHCGGPDSLNRVQVAEALLAAKGLDPNLPSEDGSAVPRILPTKRADVDLGYVSPLCLRFSSERVEQFLGRPMRAMAECIRENADRI